MRKLLSLLVMLVVVCATAAFEALLQPATATNSEQPQSRVMRFIFIL